MLSFSVSARFLRARSRRARGALLPRQGLHFSEGDPSSSWGRSQEKAEARSPQGASTASKRCLGEEGGTESTMNRNDAFGQLIQGGWNACDPVGAVCGSLSAPFLSGRHRRKRGSSQESRSALLGGPAGN